MTSIKYKLNLSTFFLFFLLFFYQFYQAFAQSPRPMYDFGSMQQGKTFSAEPGETINLSLFFFVDKEYGNRITHVSLDVSEKPEGWDIQIIPPKHKELVNVSGILVESEENIYVEPREVLPQKPQVAEEGISYILSPSGKGYLQAKEVKIVVKVPPNAKLGQTYPLKISAEAFWFGSEGNIALRQSRTFRYEIKVVRKEFSEEIVKQKPPVEQEEKQTSPQFDYYLIATVVIIILLLVFAAYKIFFSKSSKEKKTTTIQKTKKKNKKK